MSEATDEGVDNTLPGYFIAPNAFGDLCVWREAADAEPRPVLFQTQLRGDPALWGVLAAALEVRDV